LNKKGKFMAFTLQANDENINVVFEGDVGIDQAHALWEQMMQAGISNSVLTVDAGSCDSADFSILQLLWAAKAQAKSFVVENPSAGFLRALDRAGLRREFRGALHGQL
jgi:ABC-type transporter Mla MlaB component